MKALMIFKIFLFSFILSGCFRAHLDKERKPDRLGQQQEDRSHAGIDGSTLITSQAKAEAVPVGDHHSVRLTIEADAQADYVEYQAFLDGESKPQRIGRIYLQDEVIHDLAAGKYVIVFRACVEERHALSPASLCGESRVVYFAQKENHDQKLKILLKNRDDLLKKQAEAGHAIVKAAELFEKHAALEPALPQLVDLHTTFVQVKTMGGDKLGEVIAKTNTLEAVDPQAGKKDQAKKNTDKDKAADEKKDGEDGFSPTNGVAILYLVGVALSRFENKFPDAVKIANDVNDLRKKIESSVQELRTKEKELWDVKKKLKGKTKRNHDLSVKQGSLSVEVEHQEKALKSLLEKDLPFTPSSTSLWTKRIGFGIAFVGAGLILFTDYDEKILRVAEKLLGQMTLALAEGGEKDAISKLQEDFTLIEREIFALKQQTVAVEEEILEHVQNL